MRCINCGEEGPHFVPPSLGEEGFFYCKRAPYVKGRAVNDITEEEYLRGINGSISEREKGKLT